MILKQVAGETLDSEEQGVGEDYPFGAEDSQDGFYEGVGSWEESPKNG